MLRKSLVSLLVAVALLSLLVAAVSAQTAPEEEEPEAASIEPMGGGIVQAIPLTLTINVPGPDGIQTIEVPIVLSLDIQIALGNVLTSSVVVTAEVAEAEATIDAGEAITETEATAVATTAPTATPTTAPPTATPAPPTATPRQAAATATPADQAQEAEATEAPEAEPTDATAEEEVTPTAEEGAEGGEGEATPEPESEAIVDPENCSDPRSVIYEPAAGAVISGTVDVYGTARHEMFNYYKLEYQQVGSETGEFAFIMDSNSSVPDGTLAELDTTELDNGAYVLRLTVVDNTGNFPPQCSVPVEIAN